MHKQTLREFQEAQRHPVIDMGGTAMLANKWHQERLMQTEIKPNMIQNIPNQRYLNVSNQIRNS